MKVIVGATAEQQVKVAAQPNILPLIKTEVVDGQLIVTLAAQGVVTTTSRCSLTVDGARCSSRSRVSAAPGATWSRGPKL